MLYDYKIYSEDQPLSALSLANLRVELNQVAPKLNQWRGKHITLGKVNKENPITNMLGLNKEETLSISCFTCQWIRDKLNKHPEKEAIRKDFQNFQEKQCT